MATQENNMRVAEILSDLVSLRVCDPNAALALVSTRSTPSSQAPATNNEPNTTDTDDEDLKRAKDLLKLHYEVKEAQKRGLLGRGLAEARRGVEWAVEGR